METSPSDAMSREGSDRALSSQSLPPSHSQSFSRSDDVEFDPDAGRPTATYTSQYQHQHQQHDQQHDPQQRGGYGYGASFDFDAYGDGVDIDDIRANRTTIAVANGASLAEPPSFPAARSSSAGTLPRASSASSVHVPQPPPTVSIPPFASLPAASSSSASRSRRASPSPLGSGAPLSSSQRSVHESLSYLTETPIEEYVAKYQVVKHSWRGKYERIFALSPTRFCTIDPKDFEVTNTWPLTALLNVVLDESDPEMFTLLLKGTKKDEQLKLKCRFRSHLLSDLFRQQERSSSSRAQRVQTQFPCSKWARTGMNMDGLVEIGKDGMLFLRRDGSLRSTYLFVEMAHVSVVSGSSDGFVISYGGRPRLFFSDRRSNIVALIGAAAASLGLNLPARSGLTIASIQQERHLYGTDVGAPFVQFHVQKLTRKYSTPVDRTLSLHQKHLVELDMSGGVVSCFPYSEIYVLVRSPRNQSQFDIQFLNGSSTAQYASNDRDGVLAAIYDLCVTCNESPELFITSASNERGLRLLPSFATEDTAETHTFFGDTSIGICFLQRMTAVGKFSGSRKSSDRGFIAIVQEFNANVPASGILYDTKQSIIVEALRPIGAQLFYISKSSPIASRSAVILLQALFRISSSFYGFREVAQIPQLAEALTNLLVQGDEFAVFWTTLLLKKLTVHTVRPSFKIDGPSLRSSEEVEAYNKSVLFGDAALTHALIGHLHGVDIRGAAPTSEARYRIGPLVIMGLLQTLEAALCSRKVTTGPPEFQRIIAEIATFYSTLLKILFQSRCATTVEACTLLLKAIVEECDPAVATQIRDAALAEGIVLRHFYQAVFDASFDQRSVSRYLISLWMSHHPSSKQLLRRMLPAGFIPLLDEHMPSAAELLEMDQIEREQANSRLDEELIRLSSLSDEQMYGQDGWSAHPGDEGSPESKPAAAADNGRMQARSSSLTHLADAPPLPRDRRSSITSGAETRTSLVSTRDSIVMQIESDYTKSRMLQKMQSSFLLTSSTSKSRTGSGLDGERTSESSTLSRDSMRGHKRDLSRSGGLGMIVDESQRVRKRDIAYDFIANAISKSKTQRPHPTKIKRGSRGSAAAGYMRDNREPENFRILFYTLSQDHERVDLIWNATTRAELKRALLREIQQFGTYQNSKASGKAVWNYEDFSVEYTSLRKEPVVGGCYLRVLCGLVPHQLSSGVSSNKEDTFVVLEPEEVGVRDPSTLIERLYRRILRENIKAEHHNELEMTLACTQGLAIVAGAYASFGETTELDEIDYLVQLMLDTVHTPVLESLLRGVRALALARPNARKLLATDTMVETIVRLLQLGHVGDRATHSSGTPPKQVWKISASPDADQSEPMSVEELRQWLTSNNETMPVHACHVVRCEDQVCKVQGDQTVVVPLLQTHQLRWEVGIQGVLSPLEVAHDAIQTLLAIAHSNVLLETSSQTNKSLFPVVHAKVSLWRHAREVLPLLARYNSPQLCERTAKLLNFLYDEATLPPVHKQRISGHDDLTHRSSLHLWGLFYMAFLADTLHFDDFAGLLKSTHLHQDGLEGVSALVGIMPEAMIRSLEMLSAQEFTQVFNGTVASPDVIWNRDMRLHLRDDCLAHLEDYLAYLQEDVRSQWRFCPMAPVTYADLEQEVYCGGVYLRQFCEQEQRGAGSGGYEIDQPVEFMHKLALKWQHEVDRNAAKYSYEDAASMLGVAFQSTSRDVQPIYRAAFKSRARELQTETLGHDEYADRIAVLREAYRIVTCPRDSLLTHGHDPVNLLLVLSSLVTMCDRYAAQLRDYEFDSYGLLLELLQSHCTAEGSPPPFTTEQQRMDIAVRAAELLFKSCAVSARNADLLLKLQSDHLDVLEKVVRFCVNAMVAEPETHDPRFTKVCCYVLQTITGLLASQAGRMWISDTDTLIVDMVRILWFWNHAGAAITSQRVIMSKIVQQVLESISRMTMLKANQEKMLQTSAPWQLVLLFARYDLGVDEAIVRSRLGATVSSEEEYDAIADQLQNLLAIMAVRALCRLGGFFPPESELASPRDDHLSGAMDALLTPNLARLLLLESHHEFLKIFHGECESYTLYWNEEMRQEMLSFVRPRAAIEPVVEALSEDFTDAIQFRFDHLAAVFALGEIYVDALISSLMVLQQNEVPASLNDLGLTERFFKELFSFIDNGKLQQPTFTSLADGTGEPVVLQLRPHSGWHLVPLDLEASYRVTALECLALTSGVLPRLVERYVASDAQVIKMLLRNLFPPDNEVHQSNDEQDDDDDQNGDETNKDKKEEDLDEDTVTRKTKSSTLVFSDELYESARYHCIMVLDALSQLHSFGRAAYDVGICEILIEVVNVCRDVGPPVLLVLRNLCRTAARADFVTDILSTGTYIEFISWLIGVETVENDEDKQVAEALRLPAAELLGEMGRAAGALSVESLAVLNRFFPAAMSDQLVSEPHTFVSFYQQDHATPELVWNSTTREFLRNNVISLLNEYYLAAAGDDDDDVNQPRATAKSRLDAHFVDYASVYPEPSVGNVYLNLFVRSPTHRLRDPLYFVRCLWTEYETLYGDLSHLSSSLRQTRSPDDDMMAETGERFLDLVTACLVCALRTNTWVLDALAEAKVPEKCCSYLNDCVRHNLSESCAVAVVRMLRVLSTSKKCVATMQPMGSSLITCLLSLVNRSRGGVLYRETAFMLEIVRRIVGNFPSTIANGEGIVTVAMRVDLFTYLLNIVDNTGVLGPVRQPNLVRAIAIDILNTLEKDKIQARAAHDILKKHKKWQKVYRHEGMLIPNPAVPEDPFLQNHAPEIDRIVSEFAPYALSTRPVNPNGTMRTFDAAPGASAMRGTIMDKYRTGDQHQRVVGGGGGPSSIASSSNGSSAASAAAPKKGLNYKKLFGRRG